MNSGTRVMDNMYPILALGPVYNNMPTHSQSVGGMEQRFLDTHRPPGFESHRKAAKNIFWGIIYITI